MAETGRRVCLVGDDEAIRRSASFMLRTSNLVVTNYASGVERLKEAPTIERGCILLDVRMPEMDGLEVQQALKEKGVLLPVIIMTGHGDVGLAVQEMKAGAVDFIEKTFEKPTLIGALEAGFARIEAAGRRHPRADEAKVKLEVLTGRERAVLEGLVRGHPNKTIAYDLGSSPPWRGGRRGRAPASAAAYGKLPNYRGLAVA